MADNTPAARADGLLLIDKASCWTSHDVVAVIRKKLGIPKIGHAGTLDPLATGLLVLLVGGATKFQAQFQKAVKTYSGIIRFGEETDTWDAEGKILKQRPVPAASERDFARFTAALTGDIIQPVPVYSAAKFHGVPMHRLARRGETIEPPLKNIKIYAWRNIKWVSPLMDFEVECSSGTYVRSLAYMLGERLGCGAHLAGLRRTSVGAYKVDSALGIEAAKDLSRQDIEARIIKLSCGVTS